MKHDLLMEYMKFKHVASIQQANASEHEAKIINGRLDAMKKRYDEYSAQDLDIERVREKEMEYLMKMRAINGEVIY